MARRTPKPGAVPSGPGLFDEVSGPGGDATGAKQPAPRRDGPDRDGPGRADPGRNGPEKARAGQTGSRKAAPKREAARADAADVVAGGAAQDDPPLSVSQLTREIKSTLGAYGRLRVEGELSGLRRASSGHVYFDLKDEGARVSCVIWRSQVRRALRFEPEEGLQLVATGKLDVYAPRGSYSLVVEALEPRGVGALLAQLEARKRELAAKGWFERRRELPRFPRVVGVVTSRDGAALRDVLRTRSLRWPAYPLRLCHAAVQGPGSADEIARAIRDLDASGVDVIVVCRGGGSLEDLWSFNEAPVLEAIWNTSVPVVSGVGHESDTTLSDLVADHRAHTPTDAAQTVLPDRAALVARLTQLGEDLHAAFRADWQSRWERLEELATRPVLRDADWILDERARALDAWRARLSSAVRQRTGEASGSLQALAVRLERQSPRARVERWMARLIRSRERLVAAGSAVLARGEDRLRRGSDMLDAISPLRVLARGYSLTLRGPERTSVRSTQDVRVGDALATRLADGHVLSRVEGVERLDDGLSEDGAGEDAASKDAASRDAAGGDDEART